jgi:hypothetical protein
MRKLLFAALVALLVPTASHAQFQLGLRVGYSPAMGDAFKDKGSTQATKMSDSFSSTIPIQLDASYKLTKDIAAGVYFSYGFGSVGGDLKNNMCTNGISCTASTMAVGAQGIYTFNQVGGPFLPWAGLNVGWEQGKLDVSGNGFSGGASLSGFQVGLQVGGDYRVNPMFSFGPYIGYSIGQYSSFSATGDLAPAPQFDTTMHSWFNVGLAGKFDL